MNQVFEVSKNPDIMIKCSRLIVPMFEIADIHVVAWPMQQRFEHRGVSEVV